MNYIRSHSILFVNLRRHLFTFILTIPFSAFAPASGQCAGCDSVSTTPLSNKQLSSIPSPSLGSRAIENNSAVAFTTPFGQLDWEKIVSKIYQQNGKFYLNQNGLKLELTLKPDLQAIAQKHLVKEKYITGATAIIEAKSGRILALSQADEGQVLPPQDLITTAVAPTASLMKIITASAAMERSGLTPYQEISFHGGCGNLRHGNWLRDANRDTQSMTLADAFGSSCNTVFGRLAIYHTGLIGLKEYAEKFMFNRPIPSDIKIQTSYFFLPQPHHATPLEVAEAGAGFGATRISPIHAALLSSTASNGGQMMAPYLVEAAFDDKNREVYRAKPRLISKVIHPQTADKLLTLMQATISHGTGRRFFRRSGTIHDREEIGGKTGSLAHSEKREILFTLFSGAAPIRSPFGIAIGTVVASPNNYVVRAVSLAQSTLAEHLALGKKTQRLAIER